MTRQERRRLARKGDRTPSVNKLLENNLYFAIAQDRELEREFIEVIISVLKRDLNITEYDIQRARKYLYEKGSYINLIAFNQTKGVFGKYLSKEDVYMNTTYNLVVDLNLEHLIKTK